MNQLIKGVIKKRREIILAYFLGQGLGSILVYLLFPDILDLNQVLRSLKCLFFVYQWQQKRISLIRALIEILVL